MPKKMLNTAIANPIRTGVQIVPSVAITEFVDAFLKNMDDRQYAALVVVLTLAFSVLQNLIENLKGVGFLRRVPPTKVPVVDAHADPVQPEAAGESPGSHLA